MLSAELQATVAGWCAAWDLPWLASRLEIRFSKRIRRSLGRCRADTFEIRLNPVLLDGPEALLLEVLCHEVAHAAVFQLHGRVRPHGREWRGLMRAAGFEPRARLPEDALPEQFRQSFAPKVVYEHRCPVCDASRTAGRAMRRWHCGRCLDAGRKGRLEILRRPYADRELS